MRKAIILGAIVSLAAITQPANAAITITHKAPLPCAVMCAYWDVPSTAGFNECAAPFPEGSYDVTKMRLGNNGTGLVSISAKSTIDYDTFICTDTDPSQLVVSLANIVGEDCDGIGGRSAVAIGCLEEGNLTYSALVTANGGINEFSFRLYSYNWSDNDVLPVNITTSGGQTVIVTDDSYEAACPADVC
jgi:hypothetical protein